MRIRTNWSSGFPSVRIPPDLPWMFTRRPLAAASHGPGASAAMGPMTPTPPELPALEELLAGLRVVAIPMRVRFRGVTVREAALVRGPSGWAEFAPFLEYDSTEAARWLAAAVEAGWGTWPTARRD